MGTFGKQYPRIHSLTTVGIRNHVNLDLLIHEMRTDFNGESGSGKSIIGADIPQLILTGGKFYKSATKPKGNVPREYNTLSLKDFGYCFMNIEVQKGGYITIGVHIRKSPKQLTPFIVQAKLGIDPEKNPNFAVLSRPLRFEDFQIGNEILTFDNLVEHLDNKGIFVTSYFRKVEQYHKLLKLNEILHLDLSSDENLQRQYAHTLQSLARGEDIDTSGPKFKRFLFHYDDEVSNKFKQQAQQIEDDHEKYLRDWNTQNTLTNKKEVLVGLLAIRNKVKSAIDARVSIEAFYYDQVLRRKEKDFTEAMENYFLTELEVIAIKERKIAIELTSLGNDLTLKRNELKGQIKSFEDASNALESIQLELDEVSLILPKLAAEKDEAQARNNNVIQVKDWLDHYQTIENIEGAYFRQANLLRQEVLLKALLKFLHGHNLFNDFRLSEYAKSFKSAIEFYIRRKDEIAREIEYIKNIREIISLQRSDAFGSWAVRQEHQLNELQEAVVFHFATLGTSPQNDKNYIPKPQDFVSQLKKVDESNDFFVIDLNGIHYHIEKRPEYIFSNPKELRRKIHEIGQGFEQRVKTLNEELSTITRLEILFNQPLSYSEEHLSAYLNKDTIETFERDSSLVLTEDQFRQIIKVYRDDEALPAALKAKKMFADRLQQYEEKLGKKMYSDEMLKSKSTIKSQAQNKIKELEIDISDKEVRCETLRNNESAAHETRIIFWKTNHQNLLSDKDSLLIQARSRSSKFEKDSEVNDKLISLAEKLGPLKNQYSTLVNELPIIKELTTKKRIDFQNHFQKAFNVNELVPNYTEDSISEAKNEEIVAWSTYREKYDSTLATFEQDLKDNPKLKQHNYDLNALILELIPPEIISNKENPAESLLFDIEGKLAELHQKIKELSKEEATKIIGTVKEIRTIVKKQTLFLEQIQALLADFTLATHRKVSLKWNYSSDFDIKWINALESDVNELNFEDNLFGEKSRISAHELLEKTFKRYCPSNSDAKAHEILNPFNYYDAEATIVDHNDNPSPGSAGQNYGMLALLCVAKLSIVEGKTKNIFQNIEKGIRVLTIDEVAGLGQNYETLYEIAQQLDYQIFTMTVSANDLDFEDGKQIYYEFIPNSNEDLGDFNEGVQACFSKNNLIEDLEAYYGTAHQEYRIR